jgi:hypothetical protein
MKHKTIDKEERILQTSLAFLSCIMTTLATFYPLSLENTNRQDQEISLAGR